MARTGWHHAVNAEIKRSDMMTALEDAQLLLRLFDLTAIKARRNVSSQAAEDTLTATRG